MRPRNYPQAAIRPTFFLESDSVGQENTIWNNTEDYSSAEYAISYCKYNDNGLKHSGIFANSFANKFKSVYVKLLSGLFSSNSNPKLRMQSAMSYPTEKGSFKKTLLPFPSLSCTDINIFGEFYKPKGFSKCISEWWNGTSSQCVPTASNAASSSNIVNFNSKEKKNLESCTLNVSDRANYLTEYDQDLAIEAFCQNRVCNMQIKEASGKRYGLSTFGFLSNKYVAKVAPLLALFKANWYSFSFFVSLLYLLIRILLVHPDMFLASILAIVSFFVVIRRELVSTITLHIERNGIFSVLPEGIRLWVETVITDVPGPLLDKLYRHLSTGRISFYISRIFALVFCSPSKAETLALLEGFDPSILRLLVTSNPLAIVPQFLMNVLFGKKYISRIKQLNNEKKHMLERSTADSITITRFPVFYYMIFQRGILFVSRRFYPYCAEAHALFQYSNGKNFIIPRNITKENYQALSRMLFTPSHNYVEENATYYRQRKNSNASPLALHATTVICSLRNRQGKRMSRYPPVTPILIRLFLARLLFGKKTQQYIRKSKDSMCTIMTIISLILVSFNIFSKRKNSKRTISPLILYSVILMTLYLYILRSGIPKLSLKGASKWIRNMNKYLQRFDCWLFSNRRDKNSNPPCQLHFGNYSNSIYTLNDHWDPHYSACVKMLVRFVFTNVIPRPNTSFFTRNSSAKVYPALYP